MRIVFIFIYAKGAKPSLRGFANIPSKLTLGDI